MANPKPPHDTNARLFFSEYFEVDATVIEQYGALDLCLDSDLPLFIDPFLLFASEKAEYKLLHGRIVDHLKDLKTIATSRENTNRKLFQFPEIKQNWLGFCKWGNEGKGLGQKFAKNLASAFSGFYSNFGEETITSTSHIEKLTLVGEGIGRDFISDFSANLMFEYLLQYTERFAKLHLPANKRAKFNLRCVFNRELQVWQPRSFELPYFFRGEQKADFILLTPLDVLTKDEAFISHKELHQKFRQIANSLDNAALREAVNAHFRKVLPKNAKKAETDAAIQSTIAVFPEILDYYIRMKEQQPEKALSISEEKVRQLREELVGSVRQLFAGLVSAGDFYRLRPTTYQSALERAMFLKDVIENNDGYRIFYLKDKPIASEDTVQRIFRLTWFASPMDVNSEVNNGRGPADYKISYGERDSTIVEFKLGRSSSLKANLIHQTAIYQKASKSINDIKVILCYTPQEIAKVTDILKKLNQENAENIVIIDATPKISASKVR
jgi:hypothetical protein